VEFLEVLLGVLEVQPRSLGANIDAARRVAGPAVELLVPKVVGVSVGVVLDAVVALAVEPVSTLEHLGPVASLGVVVCNKKGHVHGEEHLR